MKYLPLYYLWMSNGEIPFLCNYFGDRSKEFNLFIPNKKELEQHVKEGYGLGAWGCLEYDRSYEPTPLRQNIILFMAAMNNEL